MLLVERTKIVQGALALLNTAGLDGSTYLLGDYVSLKNYGHLTVIVELVPASGTDTSALTLKQATAVAGTGEKALPQQWVWYNSDVSASDTLVKTAVVSNSVTTSNAAKNEMFVFEVDVNDGNLDIANDFDCVRVNMTDPGSVSTPVAVTYILSEPRFASATPPTAITD